MFSTPVWWAACLLLSIPRHSSPEGPQSHHGLSVVCKARTRIRIGLSKLRVVPTHLLSCSYEGLTLQTSAPYTTYGDDYKNFNLELSKLRVVPTHLLSCSDEGLTLQTSAPYTTYGDDHKNFNLELSKLCVEPTHLLHCSDECLAL